MLYAKNAGMKPVLRTSLKDEIYRGNLLYVEGRFYLIADDVQEAPNCFMTHATPCLHFVKVSRKVNPQTDKFGFVVEDTGDRLHPLIDNFPAVLTFSGTMADAKNQAGAYFADVIEVKLQGNHWTDEIKTGDILTLEGNPGEYEVVSWIRDSLTAKQKGGVLTIQARRKP